MELIVDIRSNGPNLVRGPLKLVDSSGKETTIDKPWVALCRCGQSSNKPLCDGTHIKVEFKSPEAKCYTP